MGIIELLTRVGEDHVRIQNVITDMTHIEARKKQKATAITFLTDPQHVTPTDVALDKQRYIGLIVWMPADRVAEAQR